MVARSSRAASVIACGLLVASSGRPLAATTAPADRDRLFVIARSLNANIVVYDAVRGPDGRLDSAGPVTAYWLMNAEHGQRQEINAIERAEAYGFKVTTAPRGEFELRLAALESRPIRIRAAGKRVQAIVTIAGAPAVLHRVFVRTEPDHPTKVASIELVGERPTTRAAVRETIKPS